MAAPSPITLTIGTIEILDDGNVVVPVASSRAIIAVDASTFLFTEVEGICLKLRGVARPIS